MMRNTALLSKLRRKRERHDSHGRGNGGRAEECELGEKTTALVEFVKSDPMGYVFSYLSTQDQGTLRSCTRMFQEAFQAAVRAEIHIGRCANHQRIETHADWSTRVSSGWFPLSDKRSNEAPFCRKGQRLGTIAVNPNILFNGASRIPDNFLRGCLAESILYFQVERITSAGDGWMADCPYLTCVHFDGFCALTTVGDEWLWECIRLASASFAGLRELATVGDGWLRWCPSLTSASFEGLTALTTVGDEWLLRKLQRKMATRQLAGQKTPGEERSSKLTKKATTKGANKRANKVALNIKKAAANIQGKGAKKKE